MMIDGGNVYLKCCSCKAYLVDLICTNPESGKIQRVRANCPFCGDGSFTREIYGDIFPAGTAASQDDDEPMSTFIEDAVEDDDGVMIFSVKKASENAKAVYHVQS